MAPREMVGFLLLLLFFVCLFVFFVFFFFLRQSLTVLFWPKIHWVCQSGPELVAILLPQFLKLWD